MMQNPVTEPAEVAEIAAAIRAAGAFALDLEFVSESRYVPVLALVQIGWGEPDAPEVAAIDPLAVDARPLAELVADPAVRTWLHAGQADLALLWNGFGARAENLLDTQIAAAFLGLGEQVSYAALVERLLGVPLDKAAQFTPWAQRPLTPEQIAYALDDVRYLPRVATALEGRLAERGRLAWVAEESARLARAATERTPPEEIWRRIRGWNALRQRQLGALRALAAWREREALASNKPPSWILQDRAMLELARRLPSEERGVAAQRGVPEATARRHAAAIVEALRLGAADPPPPEPRPKPPTPLAQAWGGVLAGLVQARAAEADVASRFVGPRSDADALAEWWATGDRSREPDLPLLQGWRRELAGQAALDWLAGRTAIAADDGEASPGLKLLDVDEL